MLNVEKKAGRRKSFCANITTENNCIVSGEGLVSNRQAFTLTNDYPHITDTYTDNQTWTFSYT